MKNRDYRELQLSSSQLVFIFIGILILGVIIFLLGVSVGKKQTQIIKTSQLAADEMTEQVKDETTEQVKKTMPLPTKETEGTISKEIATHQKIKEEAQKQPPSEYKKGLYYIQVGAFNDNKSAQAFAGAFKQKGFTPHVLDPFPSDKKPVYRVRLGGYATRDEAIKEKQKLIKPGTRRRDQPIIILEKGN